MESMLRDTLRGSGRSQDRMSVSAFETTGLSKRFGAPGALRDCTLRVPEGHVTALVGSNGAGNLISDYDDLSWEGSEQPPSTPGSRSILREPPRASKASSRIATS